MSFHNLSISVLKVGRQLAGSLVVAAFFLLGGCLKEEEPVKPYERGDVVTRSINLSSDYRYQVFYSLTQDSIMSRNLKTDWDLAFDANTEGGKVYLNSAKYMSSWKTKVEEIELLNDTVGFYKNHRWDAANQPDSLAIGDVRNVKNAFWIDRGYDEKGEQLDFAQIKFISVDSRKYVIKIAKQPTGKPITLEIQKDTTKNLVYFSFNTLTTLNLEPRKTDWDFQFTQYIHNFSNPYLAYPVTGVILNPHHTLAAVDSTLEFKKIDINMAKNFKLTTRPDVIGYNWKDFVNNTYKINTHWNYVIRDVQGFYYKLRFIDYYDTNGTKGNPKFEFQKL